MRDCHAVDDRAISQCVGPTASGSGLPGVSFSPCRRSGAYSSSKRLGLDAFRLDAEIAGERPARDSPDLRQCCR